MDCSPGDPLKARGWMQGAVADSFGKCRSVVHQRSLSSGNEGTKGGDSDPSQFLQFFSHARQDKSH